MICEEYIECRILYLKAINRAANYCPADIELCEDQFCIDDFLCTGTDTTHSSDPCQLILCFQLLIDALFFRHLLYKQIEPCSCLGVDVGKVAVEFAAKDKVIVDHGAMLSKVLLVLSALETNGTDFFVRDDQTRQIIISMQFIPKSVAVVVDVFFHNANLRISFICSSAERL